MGVTWIKHTTRKPTHKRLCSEASSQHPSNGTEEKKQFCLQLQVACKVKLEAGVSRDDTGPGPGGGGGDGGTLCPGLGCSRDEFRSTNSDIQEYHILSA